MVNITHKQPSLRRAIAEAIVQVSQPATMEAVLAKKIPKGDIFEFARAAGLLAIKKTADVIPDCHPLPVEFAAITYRTEGLSIIIQVEAHTIYKTGVEVEAMHGAAITALTMYDMLKPIDPGTSIGHIRLVEKKGGKSDRKSPVDRPLKTAIVVCSDTVTAGKAEDLTGPALQTALQKQGLETASCTVIPDDTQQIQATAQQLQAAGFDLVLFAGGTGLSPKDLTPDALRPLLDREIPGIGELARQYGQSRMPFAFLSRSLGGFMGQMLVIALPGSPKGAVETVDALFHQVLHVFKVIKGEKH